MAKLSGKFAVLSQDGWCNAHQEPVIVATLTYGKKTYPMDFESSGSAKKTAFFCAQLAKNSIEKAESQ